MSCNRSTWKDIMKQFEVSLIILVLGIVILAETETEDGEGNRLEIDTGND